MAGRIGKNLVIERGNNEVQRPTIAVPHVESVIECNRPHLVWINDFCPEVDVGYVGDNVAGDVKADSSPIRAGRHKSGPRHVRSHRERHVRPFRTRDGVCRSYRK